MTIPTDATHEVFIHDLNVVRVDVRMSALEPGLRALVEKLSQELHEARAHLYNARQSRDEYLDELEEIRHLLGAGPGVTALEAVKEARKEAPRLDSDEWARAQVLDDIRAALGTDARGPGLVAAVRGVVAALASAREELDGARAGLAAYEELANKADERAAFFAARSDEARAELTGLQDVNVAVRSIVGIGNGESLIAAVGRVVDRLRTLESAIRTLGKVLP